MGLDFLVDGGLDFLVDGGLDLLDHAAEKDTSSDPNELNGVKLRRLADLAASDDAVKLRSASFYSAVRSLPPRQSP